MNILFFINCDTIYGANLSMFDLIDGLEKLNHGCYVIAYKEGVATREFRKRNIPYGVVPYNVCAHVDGVFTKKHEFNLLKENIFLLGKIKEFIDLWDIDIIHTNASNVNIGAMAALRYSMPHIWHIRELLLEDYQLRYDFPMIDNFLMQRAYKVIAISAFVKNKRKLMQHNVIALPDGLAISKYAVKRKTPLFSDGIIRILFCGAIIESKGVMDIVQAVDLLVNKYNMSNVILDIAGVAGDIYAQMMSFIKQKNLAQNINYLGHQNDLLPLRKKADIAVVCSRNEGLGRVTIESMLSENLVIGANVGCTKDLISDGKNGILYRVSDAEDLAEKIKLSYNNPVESENIIKRAKKYALKHFDNEKYAKHVADIYRGALVGRI